MKVRMESISRVQCFQIKLRKIQTKMSFTRKQKIAKLKKCEIMIKAKLEIKQRGAKLLKNKICICKGLWQQKRTLNNY